MFVHGFMEDRDGERQPSTSPKGTHRGAHEHAWGDLPSWAIGANLSI